MRRDLPPIPDGPDDHLPGGPSDLSGSGAEALATLEKAAADYHRLLRQMLAAYVTASDSAGEIVRLTGLPPGAVLELDGRLPLPVVRQLQSVADRLDVLPDVARLFVAGVIEFDDLAMVVRETRRLSGAPLAEVDAWAACRAADLANAGRLHRLADDVACRVEQLRAPGWASRQERREQERSQVTGQHDFDGGGQVFADLDRIAFPTVWGAINTVAGPPSPDVARKHQRADALVAIAEHAIAGTGPAGAPGEDDTTPTDDTPSDAEDNDADSDQTRRPVRGEVRIPTRPRARITVVVDLAQTTGDRFALLQRITGLRSAPTLSARLTQTLAAEAELLVQVTNGRRPLAELRAEDIPAAVRRAVVARDRGCRAPGCQRPARECDVHHIVRRTDGGPHDPDNLALLCRDNHRGIDLHKWDVSLDPITAVMTWTHPLSRRTYRTVPHGTRPPPRPPDDTTLPEWLAPPIPDVPPDEPPPDPGDATVGDEHPPWARPPDG